MNPELEKLIDFALADGVLTEKEKEILYKKANELKVDIDEFEMVLNGKLHIRQKELAQESNSTATLSTPPPIPQQSNKQGDIKKCPACGASVPSFTTKCSDCGHEFRNVQAAASISKLNEQLQTVAETVRKEREEMKVTWSNAHLKHPANVAKAISTMQASIISSFPIPNTKEDILEFLSQSVSKANVKIGSGFMQYMYPLDHAPLKELKNAWKAKSTEVIMKARFSMREDKKTLEEIEHYAKQLGIK